MLTNMKNLRFSALFCVFSFLLIGCSPITRVSSSKRIPDKGNSNLIITEFLTGSSPSDRAIEISNTSEEVVNLDGFAISIYKRMEKKPGYVIRLDNFSILPHGCFVVTSPDSCDEIKKKANIITEDFFCDGTWPVALTYQGEILDILGQIGYQTEFAKRKSLVRKEEYFIEREAFNSYDWMSYPADDFSNLGTYKATITEEELLEGPKLTEEMAELPFITEYKGEFVGGGGFVEVTLGSMGDGDTTRFNFPSSLREYGIYSNESVRYLKINTPEIQHGDEIDAQPWGYAAKEYNNNVLRNAKHFIVQTEKFNAYRETYDRMLLYVWYSNKDNPLLSDYRCLNCEMLKQGLAFTYFASDNAINNPLLYKGLSYTSIFMNAEAYATKMGLKIHGEIDPNFNY